MEKKLDFGGQLITKLSDDQSWGADPLTVLESYYGVRCPCFRPDAGTLTAITVEFVCFWPESAIGRAGD